MFLSETYRKITRDGLWDNNIVFSQNLALCPLLAVTGTATNGLGMGLATLVVLIASNGIISMTRQLIPNEVRIPVFVLLIASLVTLVDMAMNSCVCVTYRFLSHACRYGHECVAARTLQSFRAFYPLNCHQLCNFGARRILCLAQ